MNRLRPDKIADERQMADRIADLERLIHEARGYWPQVQRQAREMGSGFPSSSIAGYGGGGGGSTVENALDDNGNLKWDPAEVARDALTNWDSAYYSLKSVVKQMHRLVHGAERFVDVGQMAPVSVEPKSPDDCLRCHRVISGTVSTDQNKSGFCVDCFDKWVAIGRPERGDFQRMPDCAECHQPVVRGEGRQFADMPDAFFHSSSCYYRVYRQRRSA